MLKFTAITLFLAVLTAVSDSVSRYSYTDQLVTNIGQQQNLYHDQLHDYLLDCHCPEGYVCRSELGVRRCVIDYWGGGGGVGSPHGLSIGRAPTFWSDLMGGATGGDRQLVGFFRTRPSDLGVADSRRPVGEARDAGLLVGARDAGLVVGARDAGLLVGARDSGLVGGPRDSASVVEARDSRSSIRGVRGDNYWGMLTSLRSRSGMSICARYDVPRSCRRKFSSGIRKFTFNHVTGRCKEVTVCTSCYNVDGVRYNLFDTLYDCTLSCGRFQ